MGVHGEPYDRVVIQGQTYDFLAGREPFIQNLSSHFPREALAIEKYVRLIAKATRAASPFLIEKMLPSWISKSPLGLALRKPFLRHTDRTTWEIISSLTSNPELLGVLTAQYGDYGLPPRKSSFGIHAMVAHHYLDGGNYIVGGSSQIANTFLPVVVERGGKILLKASVKEILVHHNAVRGVRLAGGEEIECSCVISNAGVMNTYGKLLHRSVAEKNGLPALIQKVSPSMAHIALYLGFKESAKTLGLPKYNYWIYPGYDHDQSLMLYEQDPANPLPFTYLSFPSAKDPLWEKNHPRTSVVEVIGAAPYQWFQPWQDKPWRKRGAEYDDLKAQFADRLLKGLFGAFPSLKDKIGELYI